jgi:hypothetical protein
LGYDAGQEDTRMNTPMLFACAALALVAGVAQAQPVTEDPPTTSIVCLEVGGHSVPPVCHVPASRIDRREDICLCHEGVRTVVPVCPPGVAPPPESASLDRARRDAVQSGTLVGMSWQGRPICVAPRNSGLNRAATPQPKAP